MKTMLKFFTFAAVLFGFASISFAQDPGNTSTASAYAGARVLEVIKLTKNENLEFGNIVSGAGTVVIAAEAGVTRTGTQALIAVSTTDRLPTAAKFTVTGEEDCAYSISIPTATLEIVHATDNSAKMTVGAWALSTTHATTGNTISDDGDKNVFYVGGTLTASAGQKAGIYKGSFDVTVAYE